MTATPSSSTTTTIHLRDARWGDLPQVASLLAQAYWDNELMGERLHPRRHAYPGDFTRYWLRQMRRFFWDWRSRFLVAVERGGGDGGAQGQGEGAGRLVGYAHWLRKGDDPAAKAMDLWWFDPRNLLQPLTKLAVALSARLAPNRAADPAWIDAPDESYAHFSDVWSGARSRSWFLECLGVAPGAQGRGVGRRLVRWGLDQAAREEGGGVCASVIVAPGKDGFYQKCGFDEQFGSARQGEGNPLREVEGWDIWWWMPKAKEE